MCRTELSDEDYLSLTFVEQQDQDHQEDNQEDEWMINPLTRRRIKIGGKTWLYLKNSGTI
jgi:hypothetical protein